MRCSHLRALRQTTALLSATCLYAACTPGETVSDDGYGGSTGAAGASGRGGATGAAGTGTAGTTGVWNDKNVAGITIWGYIVGSTWVTNSGLMTSSGTMRPAMTWLMGSWAVNKRSERDANVLTNNG